MGIITVFSNPGFSNSSLGSQIGEDTVALLESIADTFDIRFPEESSFPATVGKLCELVISCLPANRTTKCVSSMTFYSLRRAMIRVLGARRESVVPATRLVSLLSEGRWRRREWKALERQLALKLPRLAFSNGVEWSLFLGACGFALAAVAQLWPRLDFGEWLMSVLGIAFATLFVWAITRARIQPLATRLPRKCETVRDIVSLIVAGNYGRLVKRAGGWNEKEIWNALRQFIADETSIEPAEITPETAFPDGLNIY
jgi:hypothetical protein